MNFHRASLEVPLFLQSFQRYVLAYRYCQDLTWLSKGARGEEGRTQRRRGARDSDGAAADRHHWHADSMPPGSNSTARGRKRVPRRAGSLRPHFQELGDTVESAQVPTANRHPHPPRPPPETTSHPCKVPKAGPGSRTLPSQKKPWLTSRAWQGKLAQKCQSPYRPERRPTAPTPTCRGTIPDGSARARQDFLED